MAGRNKSLHMVAFIVLVLGGLNLLVLGLFNWDVGQLFGGMEAAVSRIIYVIVGIAAVYEAVTHKLNCKSCTIAQPNTSGTPNL